MQGRKWEDLQNSLKETLNTINKINKNSKVTIINFSNKIFIDYQDKPASSINVYDLTFQNGGTNFSAAFIAGFEQIQRITKNDTVLVFMTDGMSDYPKDEIAFIREYINSSYFKKLKIKFDFNALGFQCKSDILDEMARELGGTTYFAQDAIQLKRTFIEILNK